MNLRLGICPSLIMALVLVTLSEINCLNEGRKSKVRKISSQNLNRRQFLNHYFPLKSAYQNAKKLSLARRSKARRAMNAAHSRFYKRHLSRGYPKKVGLEEERRLMDAVRPFSLNPEKHIFIYPQGGMDRSRSLVNPSSITRNRRSDSGPKEASLAIILPFREDKSKGCPTKQWELLQKIVRLVNEGYGKQSAKEDMEKVEKEIETAKGTEESEEEEDEEEDTGGKAVTGEEMEENPVEVGKSKTVHKMEKSKEVSIEEEDEEKQEEEEESGEDESLDHKVSETKTEVAEEEAAEESATEASTLKSESGPIQNKKTKSEEAAAAVAASGAAEEEEDEEGEEAAEEDAAEEEAAGEVAGAAGGGNSAGKIAMKGSANEATKVLANEAAKESVKEPVNESQKSVKHATSVTKETEEDEEETTEEDSGTEEVGKAPIKEQIEGKMAKAMLGKSKGTSAEEPDEESGAGREVDNAAKVKMGGHPKYAKSKIKDKQAEDELDKVFQGHINRDRESGSNKAKETNEGEVDTGIRTHLGVSEPEKITEIKNEDESEEDFTSDSNEEDKGHKEAKEAPEVPTAEGDEVEQKSLASEEKENVKAFEKQESASDEDESSSDVTEGEDDSGHDKNDFDNDSSMKGQPNKNLEVEEEEVANGKGMSVNRQLNQDKELEEQEERADMLAPNGEDIDEKESPSTLLEGSTDAQDVAVETQAKEKEKQTADYEDQVDEASTSVDSKLQGELNKMAKNKVGDSGEGSEEIEEKETKVSKSETSEDSEEEESSKVSKGSGRKAEEMEDSSGEEALQKDKDFSAEESEEEETEERTAGPTKQHVGGEEEAAEEGGGEAAAEDAEEETAAGNSGGAAAAEKEGAQQTALHDKGNGKINFQGSMDSDIGAKVSAKMETAEGTPEGSVRNEALETPGSKKKIKSIHTKQSTVKTEEEEQIEEKVKDQSVEIDNSPNAGPPKRSKRKKGYRGLKNNKKNAHKKKKSGKNRKKKKLTKHKVGEMSLVDPANPSSKFKKSGQMAQLVRNDFGYGGDTGAVEVGRQYSGTKLERDSGERKRLREILMNIANKKMPGDHNKRASIIIGGGSMIIPGINGGKDGIAQFMGALPLKKRNTLDSRHPITYFRKPGLKLSSNKKYRTRYNGKKKYTNSRKGSPGRRKSPTRRHATTLTNHNMQMKKYVKPRRLFRSGTLHRLRPAQINRRQTSGDSFHQGSPVVPLSQLPPDVDPGNFPDTDPVHVHHHYYVKPLPAQFQNSAMCGDLNCAPLPANCPQSCIASGFAARSDQNVLCPSCKVCVKECVMRTIHNGRESRKRRHYSSPHHH